MKSVQRSHQDDLILMSNPARGKINQGTSTIGIEKTPTITKVRTTNQKTTQSQTGT